MNIIDILNGRGGGAILLAIILAIVIVISLVRKSKPKQVKEVIQEANNVETTPLDLNDEDATIACLIASIECRNEFKKNVRVVSVRRI